MPSKKALIAPATVVALGALGWYEALRLQPTGDVTSSEHLNVEISAKGDSVFAYWNRVYSDAEHHVANRLGDTLLVLEQAHGFVDLRAEHFEGCDPSVVAVTDSTLIPVGIGVTDCIVRHGDLTDTLRVTVRDQGGRLVVEEGGADGAI